MNAPVLPGPLADNPRLDRWVTFPAPGKVTVGTGRVELGQGVLTAMAQIAADELGVAMETHHHPLRRHRIHAERGLHCRQPVDPIRRRGDAAGLRRCAWPLHRTGGKSAGLRGGELGIRDGAILRNGAPTGQDYWTLAGAVDLTAKATGSGKRKAAADFASIGQSSARLDLPAKIFGERAFIHDMVLEGMVHARVVRQPNRGAAIEAIDEQAIKRAAKAPVEFVRNGNFLAIVGNDETAVDAAALAASNHVTWKNVEKPTPLQQEAAWLVQRPSEDRMIGPAEPADAQGRERFEATYTKPHIAHASISPSCGLALYKDGQLTVWTHCQGVFPLRAALARALKLDASKITVQHVQGAGCYGHNGADDAAADAAIIAMKMPGKPVRVRWRREEEFIYEPKQPAMTVKVRALVDADGKPSDWTAEIWSGNHNGRPGGAMRCCPRKPLPISRRCRPQTKYPRQTAAAPPVTPSRCTTSRRSKSYITWCARPRCASPRCAG